MTETRVIPSYPKIKKFICPHCKKKFHDSSHYISTKARFVRFPNHLEVQYTGKCYNCNRISLFLIFTLKEGKWIFSYGSIDETLTSILMSLLFIL